MHDWPYLIVGAVFVAAGVSALIWIIRLIRLSQRVRTWPTVPAFVTRSEIVKFTDSEGNASYHLDATYRYEVEGVKHWGGFRPSGNSKSDCAKLLKRYAVGTEVEVRYDPADSATSSLALGDGKSDWEGMVPFLLFVSVLIVAGIWISFTTLRNL